jgi:hypothetical protein
MDRLSVPLFYFFDPNFQLHFIGTDPIGPIPIRELPKHPVYISLPTYEKSPHPVDPPMAAEKNISYLGVNVYHDGCFI